MEDIPKTVKWLLAFANLGCTPGILNPQRCKSFRKFRELDRPPTDQPANITSLKPSEWPHTRLDSNRIKDEHGYTWLRTWGKPVFLGKDDYYPALQDFKDFFRKEGLPHTKVKDYVDIVIPSRDGDHSTFKLFLEGCEFTRDKFYKSIEKEAYLFLKSMLDVSWACFTHTIQTEGNSSYFEREVKEYIYWFWRTYKGDPTLSDTLPMALYATILDFWDNHRRLHPLIKQCVCGSFFKENTGKKPKVFCHKKCNDVFHKQGKVENSKSASASQKNREKKEKKNDYNAIKEFYIKAGYNIENADIHATKWVFDEGKTLKNFEKVNTLRVKGMEKKT